MRRAVVHVGMPRTGTTTLQRILSDHRDRLAAHGILYPDLTPASAAAPHLSHQHLGETLDGRRPARERTELLRKLAAALQHTPCDVVLLSYESLALAPARRHVARRLAEVLRQHGFAMEVLVTVKPQSEYINSMYTWRTQFLKEGRDVTHYAAAALTSPKLRYADLLLPWRSVAARVLAVPVRDRTDAAPLVSRVLDTIGLHGRAGPLIADSDLALVENASPGPLAVEAARRLAGATGAAARDVTRMIERLARAGGADRTPFQGIGTTLRAQIAAKFAAENERFAALAWGAPWASRVAEAPSRPVNELAGRTVTAMEEARLRAIVAEVAAACRLVSAGRLARGWRRLADIAFSSG